MKLNSGEFQSCSLCSNILTGAKQKWGNIIIQSNESMPCPVINTKQINSCETDGPGSAIKGQYTEELLLDPSCLRVKLKILYFVKQKQINCTLEKILLISPHQQWATGRINSWHTETFLSLLLRNMFLSCWIVFLFQGGFWCVFLCKLSTLKRG